ncbi:hypothetical protein K2F43_00870 [Clostridium estertheticum]|uniref:hypothetical protein n=1 Tax=Clostridium estertheticum TaxID=238834 RepID=UPI001C6DF7AE|nr:hypothetical protein [Clostridium estertheticum]MBW9169753.1 hypothetical protein [Clostridium estertheticum]WLC74741.1 hypothetical protein KTC99_18595 [Clostridium estertheticum]
MAKSKDKVVDENTTSPTDFKESIIECLSSKKMYDFVKWYCTSDQTEQSFEAVRQVLNNVIYDYAMLNYLNRADVQSAIKLWTKKTKDMNMIKVYNVMLGKALDGDVKSAEYIMKFNNSSFFEDEADSEAHNFMKNLNIGNDTESSDIDG